jgi:hypothetical protein
MAFPGCGAARSGAPLIRDRHELGVCNDPGSAAHHSASLHAALRPGNRARDARDERGHHEQRTVLSKFYFVPSAFGGPDV